MYRWSKIPEEHRPEIISDIFDDKFLTLVVQNYYSKKISRKGASLNSPFGSARATYSGQDQTPPDVSSSCWEGYYHHRSQSMMNIINKNIPCVLMHKVKNNWISSIDTVVYFMTGDFDDIFLIHPKDLMEWDPNDQA